MNTLFMLCAIVGGVTLLIQLIMTLLGIMDFDMPEGVDVDGIDAGDGLDVDGGLVTHDMGVDIDGTSHTTLSVTFGLLSFRAIIAALTLFGLTGLLMDSLDVIQPISMAVALTSGLGAMVLVAWLMRTLYQLRADGTAHIGRAINHRASVYIPIPAGGDGKGKIQVNLQGRTMEYGAITAGKGLQSGDTVLITRIVSSNTVEVEPAFEVEEA